MRSLLLLVALPCALALATPAVHAANPAPAKAPELRTALRPDQSPPLSAAQRARLALLDAPLPPAAPAATPGIKPEPLSTSLPHGSGDPLVLSPVEKLPFELALQRQRELAGVLGRPASPTFSPTKPAPLVTARPLAPGHVALKPPAAAVTALPLGARLPSPVPLTGTRARVRPAGPKPAPAVVPAPAPDQLAPDQLAKQAQLKATGGAR